jgi:hypothetical protein
MKYILMYPIKILWAIALTFIFSTVCFFMILWNFNTKGLSDMFEMFMEEYRLRDRAGDVYKVTHVWRWAISPDGKITTD